MDELRILLVEDHRLLADSLATLLREWNADVRLLQAHDAGGLEAASAFKPNIVVLDWHVPGVDTAALAITMAEQTPPVPVLVVTGTVDVADVTAALDAGVVGYVSKSEGSDSLRQALDAVVAGGTWLSADLTRKAAEFRRRRSRPALSERQHAVLRLLARGHSNTQIGQSLSIRIGTVKTHVAAVLAALGAENRAEAAYRARAMGLLDETD